MTLQEKLSKCNFKTRALFQAMEPIMRQNMLCGWLEESVAGLEKRLSVSRSLLYQCIAEMKKQGILRKGKGGYYCPSIVAEMWMK